MKKVLGKKSIYLKIIIIKIKFRIPNSFEQNFIIYLY